MAETAMLHSYAFAGKQYRLLFRQDWHHGTKKRTYLLQENKLDEIGGDRWETICEATSDSIGFMTFELLNDVSCVAVRRLDNE